MELKSGVPGLEENIGEFVPGTALLLEGLPGKTRESIGVQFIAENLKKGASALIVLSRMEPEKYEDMLIEKGVDVEQALEENRLFFIDWYSYNKERIIGIEEEDDVIKSSRDILNVSISVNKALSELEDTDTKVALIDCLDRASNMFEWESVVPHIQKMMERVKSSGFTTLYLLEKIEDQEKITSLQSLTDATIKLDKEDDTDRLKIISLSVDYSDSEMLDLAFKDGMVGLDGYFDENADKEEVSKGRVHGVDRSKVESRSEGKTNGRVRGKTNGQLKGKTKGRVNGRTNGTVNGRTNGRVNGRANGAVNGRTNGQVNGKTNGRVNGRTNGQVNGRTNGRTNGQVNGTKGRVNGETNGTVNGKINGRGGNGKFSFSKKEKGISDTFELTSLSSDDGLVNGIGGVSGYVLESSTSEEELSLPAEDGLVNGMSGGGVIKREDVSGGIIRDTFTMEGYGLESLERTGSLKRTKTQWFRKGIGTVAIMIFLLLVPVMLNVFYIPLEQGMEVDGDFDDWRGIRSYIDPQDLTVLDESIDIREYKLSVDGGYLYIYLAVEGELFDNNQSVDSIRCFVDIAEYGYEIGGIKADKYLEIYGWEGDYHGSSLFSFDTTRSQTDWNGFEKEGGAMVASVDDALEARVWIGDLQYEEEPEVVIHSTSGEYSDISEGKVQPGMKALVAEQDNIGEKIVRPGEETRMLGIDVFSISEESHIGSFEIGLNDRSSDYIEEVGIYRGYGYEDELSDLELINQTNSFDSSVILGIDEDVNYTAKREYIITGRISNNAPAEEVVGLKLMNVTSSDGIASVKKTNVENYYITRAPSEPVVDGAFADWDYSMMDEDRFDDLAPSGEWNPNIDIRDHAVGGNTTTSFLVSVEGNMMGGVDVPYLRSRPSDVVDSDRDGIPDVDDPMPYDFNNDGVNNSVSRTENNLPDWDGDGVADYPNGNDKWLNTTIPDSEEYPEEYRNRTINRYIGEITMPVKTGNDYTKIFIDADDDITTGYRQPYLTVGAEYMIAIEGRNMEVTSANYSEYSGNGNSWGWEHLGEVEVALNKTSLETSLDLQALGVEDEYSLTYVTSDWENNIDTAWEENAVRTRASKGATTKQKLYLRDGDALSSSEGNNEMVENLVNKNDQRTNTWTSSSFAGDLNITSNILVSLYLDPTPKGNNKPGLNATLTSGGNTVGYGDVLDLTGEGWRTIEITPQVASISAGDVLELQTSITGDSNTNSLEVDIYYNSGTMDSRISIPTDKTVSLRSLQTYNSSGGLDSTFEQGESVRVVSKATDPFTADDIEYVNLTVYYPNGTKKMEKQQMTAFDSDPGNPPYWNLYEYTFSIDLNDVGGKYSLEVTATDIQGNQDQLSSTFTVPVEPGVSVYPDQTETANPGSTVSYEVFVENIGNSIDEYNLELGPSSKLWTTRLYKSGTLIGEDQDGDGDYDWIDTSEDSDGDGNPDVVLQHRDIVTYTVEKVIPDGLDGEMDTTRLIASSNNFSDVDDFAELETKTPVPQKMNSLYLHSGDTLDTLVGSSSMQTNIASGGEHTWIQTPELAGDMTLTDYADVFLYIDPTAQGHKVPDVTVSLGDSGSIIGSDTVHDIDTAGWYEFSIPTDYTVSAGNSLTLDISSGDNQVDVYYDSGTYDSRVELYTTSYVDINSIKLYNQTDETYVFGANETVDVVGRITDPLGTYDIDGAQLKVVDPDGNTLVNNQSMSIKSEDTSSPPYWRDYSYSFTLSSETPVGTYSVKVFAFDKTSGTTSSSSDELMADQQQDLQAAPSDENFFAVPGGVDVSPDNNDTAQNGTIITYDHTITNNGKGNDYYELSAGSSEGYNITIYGPGGEIIATDTGGDGTWDYVNPSYDNNNDGIPDTPKLKSGESFDITIAVEIPESATTGTVDTTTVTATSHRDSDISDSAQDLTSIPEFPSILSPVIATLAIFIGLFIYRRKREGPVENLYPEEYSGDEKEDEGEPAKMPVPSVGAPLPERTTRDIGLSDIQKRRYTEEDIGNIGNISFIDLKDKDTEYSIYPVQDKDILPDGGRAIKGFRKGYSLFEPEVRRLIEDNIGVGSDKIIQPNSPKRNIYYRTESLLKHSNNYSTAEITYMSFKDNNETSGGVLIE